MADNILFEGKTVSWRTKGVIVRSTDGNIWFLPIYKGEGKGAWELSACDMRQIADEMDKRAEENAERPWPCPFCHSKFTRLKMTATGQHFVHCEVCQARGPTRPSERSASAPWAGVRADVEARQVKVEV